AGATWVRYDLSWAGVESQPGHYDFSAYDNLTATARRHGFNVIMILGLTPSFARPAGCGSEFGCPSDCEAYSRVSKASVEHYQTYGVRAWEIWNEPNISWRWRPATQPAVYTRMLQLSYTAIKQADPTAVVIAGCTAPSATTSTSLGPAEFLRQIYEDGAQ